MRQTGAAEGWGGGVGSGRHGEGANYFRIYTYNLHLPIKGFSLRSNT